MTRMVELRWSVAEAALLSGVPVERLRDLAARGYVAIRQERMTDDDVVRSAALDRFSGAGWFADRRAGRSLAQLDLPAGPYFLVCHPNGEVFAVDPDRLVDHVSRSGAFVGFDPEPIRRRLGHRPDRPSEAAGTEPV